MSKNRKVVSKVKRKYLGLMAFGVVVSFWMAYFIINDLNYKDDFYFVVYGALISAYMAIYSLNHLFFTPVVDISENGIKRKTILGIRHFKPSNIFGFTKEDYVEKVKLITLIGTRVIIKTNKGFIVLDSIMYSNIDELYDELEFNFDLLDDLEFLMYNWKITIPSSAIVFGFGVYLLYQGVWGFESVLDLVEVIIGLCIVLLSLFGFLAHFKWFHNLFEDEEQT